MNTLSKFKISLAVACAAITFIVFLPSLQNDFILWDDDIYVYDNTFIRSFNARLLTSAFTDVSATGLWHPLTWFSHALDYALWGLNPAGHHLTNNIIHALNTFIVALLLMRLLVVHKEAMDRSRGHHPALSDRAVIITGITAALLFGIHPLRVEPVAWVSERKELLSAFFYLLTIAAYMRHVDTLTAKSTHISSRYFTGNYFLAIGLYVCALMSKPMAVSLPLVLFILDWYPYKRVSSAITGRRVVIELLPFSFLSLAASVLTFFAHASTKAITSLDRLSLASRLAVSAESLTSYLVHILAPVHLVPFYPLPRNVSLYSAEYGIPLLIIITITAACIAATRYDHHVWIAAWSYYVMTLAPVLGIVHIGYTSSADRYTYLPSLGPLLILGLSAARFHEMMSSDIRRGSNVWKVLGLSKYIIAFVIVASLSYATISQLSVWKNSISFWTYVIDAFPGRAPLAHNNLGLAYARQSRFQEAINEYRTALQIDMNFAQPHCNLGNEYLRQGNYEDALTEYRTALTIDPDNTKMHIILGLTYQQRSRFEEALKEYYTAAKLDRALAEPHNYIGLIYAESDRIDDAISEYSEALRLNPAYAAAHNNLGIAFMLKRRYPEAIREFTAAVALDADLPAAHYNLGNAYAAAGSLDLAIAEYRAAIALDPNEPDAHKHLGDAYLKQNRFTEAAKEFETARELALRSNPRPAP